jgi:general secretion pathway protein A
MTTVLIVDEAHLLSEELLEEVRLLSNLETYDDKLLQIVLVGQPELDLKLDSRGLRQLKQRIALRTHLGPLNFEETQRYIEQRLEIAGANSNAGSLFSSKAVSAIYRFSCGFPRLINTLCENSLITAFARQEPTISAEIVKFVAKEFRLDKGALAEDANLAVNGSFSQPTNGHHFDLTDIEDRIESDSEEARL